MIVKSKKIKDFERDLPEAQARNMVRMFSHYYVVEAEVEKPKKKRLKEETNKDPEMGEE